MSARPEAVRQGNSGCGWPLAPLSEGYVLFSLSLPLLNQIKNPARNNSIAIAVSPIESRLKCVNRHLSPKEVLPAGKVHAHSFLHSFLQ